MNAPREPVSHAGLDELARLHSLQRAAFARERYPTLAVRRDRLRRLLDLTRRHEPSIVDAIGADFGSRSSHETRLAEILIVANGIRDALRDVKRWMEPRRVATPLALVPGRGEILAQPLGVIGIIAPWNYPFQLAMAPAIGALAAGNRVLVKPSEITPRTSALLQQLVASAFAEDEMAVVTGGADVGRAFAATKFDHLFFTGSTQVGRKVAQAAAAQLVPVTLELGGKSPALFASDADLDIAVPRFVAGKLFNAGQTCIAPDYALVPSAMRDDFTSRVRATIERFYPTIAGNPDYTAIVSDAHYARLRALVDDARTRGATILEVNPRAEALDATLRKLAPTMIVDVDDAMAVMQEEIFGPLLPVETYDSIDDAITRIGARPSPLAFYYFGRDAAQRERVMRETLAGGVTVNDTLWHFGHEDLPFGGVGDSGIGAYHGERSFLAFSNQKSIFYQPRYAPARLLWPPYGRTFDRLLALLKRL